TLRERLLITTPEQTFDDTQLVDALRRMGLESTLERVGGLDSEHDWADALSLGEQHLIAVARLLLTPPRFAFLNQVVEGLGPEHVEHVYRELDQASITYISIGDNHHLVPHHDTILDLSEDGEWRVTAGQDVAGV